jgi:hypothetical protein
MDYGASIWDPSFSSSQTPEQWRSKGQSGLIRWLRPAGLASSSMWDADHQPMDESEGVHQDSMVRGYMVKIKSSFQTFPIAPDTSHELRNTME